MVRTRSNSLASTLRRAAACCALGAAITLAIAWWSAWRGRWDNAETCYFYPVDPHPFGSPGLRSLTAIRRSWGKRPDIALEPFVLKRPPNPQFKPRILIGGALSSWPPWGLNKNYPSSASPVVWGLEDARGWPFRAVWYEITLDEQRQYRAKGGIELPQSAPPDALTYRALPYRPIWPGLAADTAVFAIPLIFAWSFARHARAHRRLTRGLCPRCAYDLRFDLRAGCPECGWNRAEPQLSAPTRGRA